MEEKGNVFQSVNHVGKRRRVIIDASFLIELVKDCSRVKEAVDETGRVRQEMAYGDGSICLFNISCIRSTWLQDLPVCQLRYPLFYRVIKSEFPALNEDHDCGGCDQFGVGRHAHDVIGTKRLLAFDVRFAGHKDIHKILTLEDGAGGARQQVAVNVTLQSCVDLAEVKVSWCHAHVRHRFWPHFACLVWVRQ